MEHEQQQTTGAAASMGDAQQHAKEAMHGLEAYLAPIFEKFPHLPVGGQKFIVDISPWIALIFGILSLFSLLGLGGVSVVLSVLTLGMALPMLIHVLIGLLSSVLLLLAFSGLKAHTKRGWNLVFYSQVVSVIGGLVGLVMGNTYGIGGMIVGAIIGFYILFEIRSYYQ